MHHYNLTVKWVGNTGEGTRSYTAYTRDFLIEKCDKDTILGSADPAFRGNEKLWNPEELLLGALSSCHKLWYLHLCAVNNVIVLDYIDHCKGQMREANTQNKGRFVNVTLRPHITITNTSDINLAIKLHEQAHHECFIANSVNFPVLIEPVVTHQK